MTVSYESEVLGEDMWDGRQVLLIEQNGSTATAITEGLAASGYAPIRCATVEMARVELKGADLVILNLEFSEGGGLALLAELRLASAVPILVYSARQDAESIASALQCGADDYLFEPIRMVELVARMQAVARRAGAGRPPERVVRVGDIEIHLQARTVSVGGEPIRLTSREFDVLSVLARNVGVAVSRGEIAQEVWGRAGPAVSKNLDVYMTTLRTKLARPNLLFTVRGFGYRLGSR